jgi:hypothetical protein
MSHYSLFCLRVYDSILNITDTGVTYSLLLGVYLLNRR